MNKFFVVFFIFFILVTTTFANGDEIIFRWGFLKSDKSGVLKSIDFDKDTKLLDGEGFRIFFEPVKNAYIYLYMFDSAKDLILVFPEKIDMFDDGYEFNKIYILPGKDDLYSFDTKEGVEKFYLLVSKDRLEKLEDLTSRYLKYYNKGNDLSKINRYKQEVIKEIITLKRINSKYIVKAEKPISIAGTTRSVTGNSKSIKEVVIDNFYAKTLKMEH